MRTIFLSREARLALRAIGAHKLRSLLTMLGVVFGVGSVVAMLAVGEGASRQALEQIRGLGSANIFLHSVKPAADSTVHSRERMSVYGLRVEDDLRIRESIPHVLRTVPVRALRRPARLGERGAELRIVFTTPDWFDLVRRPLVAGRLLSERDAENRAAVCVLTESGARLLLANEHAIGQRIRIGAHVFEVVGIIAAGDAEAGIHAPDLDIDAYVPIGLARPLFGEVDLRVVAGSSTMELVELHQILVEVDEPRHVEAVADALRAMLRHFHQQPDYDIKVPLALLREAENTKRRFNIVLGSIAGISLLVGGIGIMNIMLASVTERTREIGIRRAIGARRGQIVRQFLIETVVLSVSGGLLGIAVGITLPVIITRVSDMPTVIPLYGVAVSFAISVLIGLVFGLYPAIRAARLDPIQALRHE